MSQAKNLWTRDQLKLAFHLYCLLPFGKLHRGNPDIIALADLIGRSPGAVAYKLCNIASLDPAITSSGRVGLQNASKLDREIWDEFHADWEQLADECEQRLRELRQSKNIIMDVLLDEADKDFSGETKAIIVQQRVKQHFFRKAVLSSYRGRCCMTGVSDSRLLVASHIVPWSLDKANRLNPSNGLCLSVLHDRAFDKGLITLDVDYRIVLSGEIIKTDNAHLKAVFMPLQGERIELPERFLPSVEFLAWHRNHWFQDSLGKHR
jgi:putative restriction endonuclease